LNEDELKCDADFEPSKLFDGILKSPATAAGGEYTAHLEAEVENLRNRLSDAWRQWEKGKLERVFLVNINIQSNRAQGKRIV
jgi:hypothetical protein